MVAVRRGGLSFAKSFEFFTRYLSLLSPFFIVADRFFTRIEDQFSRVSVKDAG